MRSLSPNGVVVNRGSASISWRANWVVPAEETLQVANEKARKIIDEGPLYAIGKTKELINNEADVSLETALETEALAQASCM